jgi:hypothetical protein
MSFTTRRWRGTSEFAPRWPNSRNDTFGRVWTRRSKSTSKHASSTKYVKHSTQPKIGKLRPLPIPKQNFYSISMDFMTNIPKVAGNDAIMIIVCRLSKWSAFVPWSKQATAEKVAQLFLDHWVRHRGFPWNIVSDRGFFSKCNFSTHDATHGN